MRFVQSPDLAWNHLGDEIIAFNLTGQKQFHSLNAPAAVIFGALETPRTQDELLSLLLEEFEVDETTARTDLETALREMTEKGLVSKS